MLSWLGDGGWEGLEKCQAHVAVPSSEPAHVCLGNRGFSMKMLWSRCSDNCFQPPRSWQKSWQGEEAPQAKTFFSASVPRLCSTFLCACFSTLASITAFCSIPGDCTYLWRKRDFHEPETAWRLRFSKRLLWKWLGTEQTSVGRWERRAHALTLGGKIPTVSFPGKWRNWRSVPASVVSWVWGTEKRATARLHGLRPSAPSSWPRCPHLRAQRFVAGPGKSYPRALIISNCRPRGLLRKEFMLQEVLTCKDDPFCVWNETCLVSIPSSLKRYFTELNYPNQKADWVIQFGQRRHRFRPPHQSPAPPSLWTHAVATTRRVSQ